ncbi:conserved hypothetical protein [Flavobacterium psychrophilum]|uniref:DUF262 domain-containing protein n=1 Tax=Flavobacterium psychrophilum TaxID=96345 RepID=UPI000B7C3DF3|nr:DUF262 domain-containing protein [Flavobacterium psychrophilum]SNB28235.1 conserved hypothetical protein [Flavobacterium psychrophilum]
MENKHTFWSLLNKYDKIEVPIIQRDYAQGRETFEAKRIRKNFINEVLVNALLLNTPVELDFVYGSIIEEKKGDDKRKIFIPLDGQQRLTTLFLLHFFVALKENRLMEVSEILKKFTYETRPSARSFCTKLLQMEYVENIANIKYEIENSQWFSDSWKNDPTIAGMIQVVNSFSENQKLIQTTDGLFDKLFSANATLISFYFTDLDKFGLTENLYIRMNARGKMLTDFENFKSEFFKIINYNHELLEQVKDKIEYAWVENFWSYREKDVYVTDVPFMNFLRFITEMLYYKQADSRERKDKNEFLNIKVLHEIYSNEENLKFLIYALDAIPKIKQFNTGNLLWKDNSSLADILTEITKAKGETIELFILYASISFLYSGKNENNLKDYQTVVRNLIQNTKDKSAREWSKMIPTIELLQEKENVYEYLENLTDTKKIIGFDNEQREEEIFKAKLIVKHPNQKDLIHQIENNPLIEGNIANFIFSTKANTVSEIMNLKFSDVDFENFDFIGLKKSYEAYRIISQNDFIAIWGDLINTELYQQTDYSRLEAAPNYKKHPAIVMFAKQYAKVAASKSLEQYIEIIQKQFITNTVTNHPIFEEIKNVKTQLYIYYIIHKRIYNGNFTAFFKNNNVNFGWLAKVPGYKSLYNKGIDGCQYFPNANPVFQVYNQQFRYNLGINRNNTFDLEVVGIGNKKNPFDKIIEWAKQ